jgi:hypothetical protein
MRYAALLGNSDAEATGKTNRTSGPQGNADGANDGTTVSRAEPVYPKPLRRIECRGTVWSPEKASRRDGLKARQVALTSPHRKSAQRQIILPEKIFCLSSICSVFRPKPLRRSVFPAALLRKRKHDQDIGQGRRLLAQSAEWTLFFSGWRRPGKWYTPPSPTVAAYVVVSVMYGLVNDSFPEDLCREEPASGFRDRMEGTQ